MKIKSFEVYTYCLPLKIPLNIGKNILNNREGFIVRISSDSNLYGLGEAAPLPGLHMETLNETFSELEKVKIHLVDTSIDNAFQIINDIHKEVSGYPSVQYAVEAALINLNEADCNKNTKNSLPPPLQQKIYINSLLTGKSSTIKKGFRQSLAKNCRSIKIKIGRQSLREEINLIRDLQKDIGQSKMLRLDANRGWTFEETVSFANAIDKDVIEYLEEPLKDPKQLRDLYEKTGLPIALDESLIDISIENFLKNKWIEAFIIKPAVLGSVKKSLQYIALGKKFDIKTVISDTFHSGIGLSFLIRLASIMVQSIPMGFDTYSWLDDDVLVKRLPVKDGYFDLKKVMDLCKEVDYSKLKRVG